MLMVIDSGASNVRGVAYSLTTTQVEMETTDRADDLRHASAVVLPWWGDAISGMQALTELGLVDPLQMLANKGVPILAVGDAALLLATTVNDEEPGFAGLNLIPGHVRRLPPTTGRSAPHFGWNTITIKLNDPLLAGIQTGAFFYFCQFCRLEPEDSVTWVATASWNDDTPVVLRHKQVVGAMFEPEKSGELGLRVMSNFVHSVKRAATEPHGHGGH